MPRSEVALVELAREELRLTLGVTHAPWERRLRDLLAERRRQRSASQAM